jgi:KDO2-lipid IV(A) lauroyltransferase
VRCAKYRLPDRKRLPLMQKTKSLKYGLLRGAWFLLAQLPFPVLYLLSDVGYFLLYYLTRYRRRITRKNLTESFPEKSKREIRSIERRFYRFFSDLMFEMCKMTSFSRREMERRMRFVNIDELNRVLDDGRSVSLFLGHYGNWEWVSSLPLHLSEGVIAGQIYHRLHNPAANRLLLRNRGQWGANSVEMHDTVRWIGQNHKEKRITVTGYIADQAPRESQVQHYVHFLHHRTTALTGAEKITRKYGFAAYYVDVERTRRGYYEARFVRLDEDAPAFGLTDHYFHLLEKRIRQRPEYYLWTHNRFKHPTTQWLQADTL